MSTETHNIKHKQLFVVIDQNGDVYPKRDYWTSDQFTTLIEASLYAEHLANMHHDKRFEVWGLTPCKAFLKPTTKMEQYKYHAADKAWIQKDKV